MPKVLLIEDEASIRAVLKDILKDQKELKLEVDEARDGAEGLEWTIATPAPYHTFETPPKIDPLHAHS